MAGAAPPTAVAATAAARARVVMMRCIISSAPEFATQPRWYPCAPGFSSGILRARQRRRGLSPGTPAFPSLRVISPGRPSQPDRPGAAHTSGGNQPTPQHGALPAADEDVFLQASTTRRLPFQGDQL